MSNPRGLTSLARNTVSSFTTNYRGYTLTMNELLYLSELVVEDLKKKIEDNLERYRGSGFSQSASEIGWNIRLEGREFNLKLLESLDSERGAQGDFKNSMIVWEALSRLTPSEANEEQIWIRLSHIEGFEYTQGRWLKPDSSEEDQISAINKHFFANGRTGIRDDHSLSRLWWNAYIANLAYPEKPERALELMLKTADIRSNIVERPRISMRTPLLHGILKVLDTNEAQITEASFRAFMVTLNRKGAGLIFESLPQDKVDDFIQSCFDPKKTQTVNS
jgi:hypothetical protein